MKLVLFEIMGVKPQALSAQAAELTEALMNSHARTSGRFGYAVTQVDYDHGLVSGVIYQEYHSGQVKMDPKTKVVEELTENPWDETVFLLSLDHGVLFLEKRKYSPANLNYQTTLARLQEILNVVWQETYGREFMVKKLIVGGDMSYFRQLFAENTVRRLQITGLYQKKIPPGTKLHNPNPSRDESWASSYNDYDSEVLEEVNLKAKKGKELKKSVMARALLAADADPKRMEIFDQAEDRFVTITKESQKELSVDVPKQMPGPTRIHKAIERILREIGKGSGFFRF